MRSIPLEVATKLAQQYGSEPIFVLEVAWTRDKTHRTAYADQKINGMEYPYPSIIRLDNFETVITVTGAGDSQSTSVQLDDVNGQLKELLNNHDIQKCPCWIYITFKGLPYSQKVLLFQGEITTPITWNEGDRTLSFNIDTQTVNTDVAFSMEEGDFPSIPTTALGKVWPLAFGTVCNMKAVQMRSPRVGFLAGGEGIHDFTLEARICQAHYLQCKSVIIGTKVVPNRYYLDSSGSPAQHVGWCMPGYCHYTLVNNDNQESGYWFGDQFVRVGPSARQIRNADNAIIIKEAMENNAETIGNMQTGLVTYINPLEWKLQDVPLSDRSKNLTAVMEMWGVDLDCVEDRFIQICELEDLLEKQKEYEHKTLTIRGGGAFPQHTNVTIDINGAKFKGSFSGETFIINDRQHPDVATVAQIECHAIETTTDGNYELQHWNSTWTNSLDKQSWFVPPEYHSQEVCTAEPVWVSKVVDGPTASQKALDDMPTSTFAWLPAGSEVYLEGETEILFIVSLIPGTVNSVSAYKRQETTGRELLMTVPTDLYTIYETDYTGYNVIEIGFEKALSKVDTNWSDDIYVSFTSDVGPNPVDIIDWLLTKYTTLTFDPVTKAAVKAQLTNYPANFVVKDKLKVMQLIYDIAYQSRCAVYVRDETLYIVYLAAEPTSIRTLTQSDILSNTLNVFLTNTDDLRTKYVANWKESEARVISTDNVDNSIILKYNVSKYGIEEEVIDYYTQNTYSTILKSATFWLIRLANNWKSVSFDTPIKHLDLDLFDCVTLNISQLSSSPVKCIITSIQYDNAENIIHFECLTPIRSGETTTYPYFWPAALDQATIFPPTYDELVAGAGYTFTVTPPIGHILLGGSTYLDDQAHITLSSGDLYPSDIGDVFPTIDCKSSSVMDIVEPDPVIEALDLAKKAHASSKSVSASSPKGEPTGEVTPACTECGVDCSKFQTQCTWRVDTYEVNRPELVKVCDQTFFGCAPGTVGYCCKGEWKSCCYTFGSRAAAESFRAARLAEIAAGKVTCSDGSELNYSPMLSVSNVNVHYGKYMNTTEPWGGWYPDKETALCGNQVYIGGLGTDGDLGHECTCRELWTIEAYKC
jgi:hypothetical protein